MSSHAIVHGQPDVSLKERLAHMRLASTKRWSLTVRRVTGVTIPAAAPQRPWMTETEAKARRVRHLMNDNPASG